MSKWFSLAPAPVGRLLDSMVPRNANAGLVWSRYLTMWEGSLDHPHPPKHLKPVLDDFASGFNERGEGPRNPARDLLRLHRERLIRALEAWTEARGWLGDVVDATVSWRLVTGLGNPHPTEVNLAFDPNIGVPYLPASAVKGLCRRTARLLDEPQSEIDRLFGPEISAPEDKPGKGRIICFDAFPKGWPKLMVDLINCHHQDYYAERLTEPLETEDPNPVNFLCVAESTRFVFPLAAETEDELTRTREWLRQGLSMLGVGAKTALGYGVMLSVDDPASPSTG